MRRTVWAIFALILSAAILLGSATPTADSSRKESPESTVSTPGLAAAEAISTITGVAISPLLGVSGVGAYKYFKAAPANRARLPWYAQPWFWGPALLLVALAFVKDTFGTALPTAVKKPFDVADAIENKISALVAAGLFVPLIATIFSATSSDSSRLVSEMGLATIDLTPLLNLLTVPAAIAAFLVVWMVSHVINVLILISPFTTVDAALKSARMFVLATVAGTAFINPYVGAVWSLLLILFCFLVVGWAYRLMIFGTIFTWDMITLRNGRFNVRAGANRVFTARPLQKTPIRTYGRLSRGADGRLTLDYRPWLIFPRQTLTLPEGTYVIERGLFGSDISRSDGESTVSAITLPPRYRSHEEELNALLSLGGVRPAGVLKGFKNFWSWLRSAFGVGSEASAAAQT